MNKAATLQQLVLEIKSSDKIAIKSENCQITYSQINELSEQIAMRLTHDLGKRNSRIVVCCKPNEKYITVLLAIAKAGMTFVPVPYDTPKSRLEFIKDNVKPDLVIDDSNISDYINNKHDYQTDLYQAKPDDMQWIVFTSGSTGTPKGVIRTQRNNAYCCSRIYEKKFVSMLKNDCEAFLILASLYFFVGINRTIIGLLLNKTVIINTQNLPETHLKYLQKINSKIAIFSTPSYFSQIEKSLELSQYYDVISFVVLCGEPLTAIDIDSILHKHYRYIDFINEYGTSEAGHCAIEYLKPNQEITCGHPQNYTKILIKSTDLQTNDSNNKGIVHIGSPSVSPGYINSDEHDTSAFYKSEGVNWFNTNDIGYIDSNGKLILSGRADRTVNLNGVRVDLNEIEETSKEVSFIDNAVCKVQSVNDNDVLVLFYVSKSDIEEQELRNQFIKMLPKSMLPSIFVKLDNIPLTKSGKINYRKLVYKPKNQQTQTPTNKDVEKICAIMKSVLNIDAVNKDSNFFELGGDSLVALSFLSEMNKIGIQMSFEQLLSNPTPTMIYNTNISLDKSFNNMRSIQNAETKEFLANRDILLHYNNCWSGNPTNSWIYLKFKITCSWDETEFNRIIDKITHEHPVFRIEFIEIQDKLKYKITDKPRVKKHFFDRTKHSSKALKQSLNSHNEYFDLWCDKDELESGNYSLAYFYCIKKSENKCILHIKITHAIVDGYSIYYVLLKELANNQLIVNDDYTEYMNWLHNMKNKNSDAIQFYKEYLKDIGFGGLRYKRWSVFSLIDLWPQLYLFLRIPNRTIKDIVSKNTGYNLTITEFVFWVYFIAFVKTCDIEDRVFLVRYSGRYPSFGSCNQIMGNCWKMAPVRINKNMTLQQFIKEYRKSISFSYADWENIEDFEIRKCLNSNIDSMYFNSKKYPNIKLIKTRWSSKTYRNYIFQTKWGIKIRFPVNVRKRYIIDYIKLISNMKKIIKDFINQ